MLLDDPTCGTAWTASTRAEQLCRFKTNRPAVGKIAAAHQQDAPTAGLPV